MYTSGSDVFTSLVETNGVTSDDYGLTAIPTEGADAGVLVGGTLAAVNVKADDATKAAAIKWIDFFYLSKLLDQEQAVADAQVRFDNGQPVGTPVLPIFSRDQYELSLEWVADFINVPLDQMTGYTSVMFDQPVVGEPSRSTQETYGALGQSASSSAWTVVLPCWTLTDPARRPVGHVLTGRRDRQPGLPHPRRESPA